jgi:hypothetical protein
MVTETGAPIISSSALYQVCGEEHGLHFKHQLINFCLGVDLSECLGVQDGLPQ